MEQLFRFISRAQNNDCRQRYEARSVGDFRKGTVYRFFNSKDEILFALLDHYEEKISERIAEATPPEASVLEQTKINQRAIIEVLGVIPAMLNVWQEFQHHPGARVRIAEIFSSTRENLEALVQGAIDHGEIPKQPIDPVVTLLLALNEGVLGLANGEPDLDTLASFDATWPLIEKAIS